MLLQRSHSIDESYEQRSLTSKLAVDDILRTTG